MRAAVIALFAIVLAFVAIAGVDAYSYRVYRGTSSCSLGSGVSITTYYATLNSCLRTNSTSTNQYIYSKLVKCNSTSGTWNSEYYGSSTTCSGTPTTTTGDTDKCITFSPATNPPSSYRIECSAGSVAFAAVVAILAIVSLLF